MILLSVVTLAALPSPPIAPTGRGVSLAVIREGLGFVRRQRVVLGCMTLDMFAVIFGGAAALLPIYATDILHVGPRGYGMLSSALEVGALATSLVLITLPPIRRVLLGAVLARARDDRVRFARRCLSRSSRAPSRARPTASAW